MDRFGGGQGRPPQPPGGGGSNAHGGQHQQGPRINEQIRISPLFVIDAEGNTLGEMSRDQALDIAREKELDLVEVVPTKRPPVCKLMDFGKFKFEQSKKARKQKQHQVQIKEIRIRPLCDANDLEVKLRHAREFLGEKDKVMIVCQFRGRETAHQEIGMDKMRQMVEALNDCSKVERPPSRDGIKKIIAILTPR